MGFRVSGSGEWLSIPKRDPASLLHKGLPELSLDIGKSFARAAGFAAKRASALLLQDPGPRHCPKLLVEKGRQGSTWRKDEKCVISICFSGTTDSSFYCKALHGQPL